MEKKGSITVFLALILSLLLSLVTTGIQSVQAAAARTQILNSMDIGLYSLFGQYDRFLMNEYDLFFIDGHRESSHLNLAAVYDNLESLHETCSETEQSEACFETRRIYRLSSGN